MINFFADKVGSTNDISTIIISLSIMMLAGFLFTRITKRLSLPNVTGYILSGIFIGPYCLNLIPNSVIEGMRFLPDIALTYIAFSTGEFFKFETLKKNGLKVLIITAFEAYMASLFVFVLCFFILKISLPFSIVLGALASATAPASTMMTIRQTKAHGDFVETLLEVVALDDVLGLILYSISISIASSILNGNFSLVQLVKPIIMNIIFLVLGGIFGYILKIALPIKRSKDSRLIVSTSLLFLFCGIASIFDISPLLGAMAMGTVYANTAENPEKLFKTFNYFSPPILLLFFVRSGVNFNLGVLFNDSSLGKTPLLVIGISYFLVRIIGKYIGSYIGASIANKSKEIKNYLGLALIPQAGVAIGLASLGARVLGGDLGNYLETIILSSSVLYELIGPASAKLSLYLSHSYETK